MKESFTEFREKVIGCAETEVPHQDELPLKLADQWIVFEESSQILQALNEAVKAGMTEFAASKKLMEILQSPLVHVLLPEIITDLQRLSELDNPFTMSHSGDLKEKIEGVVKSHTPPMELHKLSMVFSDHEELMKGLSIKTLSFMSLNELEVLQAKINERRPQLAGQAVTAGEVQARWGSLLDEMLLRFGVASSVVAK